MNRKEDAVMMQDYEYFIAISLRDKLKEMVKGRVFCEVQNDQLYIEIRTEELGIYKYYLENFSENLTKGSLSVDDISVKIVGDYRKFILGRFIRY